MRIAGVTALIWIRIVDRHPAPHNRAQRLRSQDKPASPPAHCGRYGVQGFSVRFVWYQIANRVCPLRSESAAATRLSRPANQRADHDAKRVTPPTRPTVSLVAGLRHEYHVSWFIGLARRCPRRRQRRGGPPRLREPPAECATGAPAGGLGAGPLTGGLGTGVLTRGLCTGAIADGLGVSALGTFGATRS
jgi:hypothetical protein